MLWELWGKVVSLLEDVGANFVEEEKEGEEEERDKRNNVERSTIHTT